MFWFAPCIGAALTAIIYGEFERLIMVFVLSNKTSKTQVLFAYVLVHAFWSAFFCSFTFSLLFSFSEYAPLKPKKRETKQSMSDALFMAEKKRWVFDCFECLCLLWFDLRFIMNVSFVCSACVLQDGN
jgi:hypothetical protein